MSEHQPINELQGYDYFQRKVNELAGIDLRAYKDRQVMRRLAGYIRRKELPGLYALARQVERDPAALRELKDFLTINVSEFFRNPERFALLARTVIPGLLERFGTLRIWSAGCSLGAEPYSLAILLNEVDPSGRHQVVATDIDETILKEAAAGEYSGEVLRGVSPERLRKYFEDAGDGRWRVASSIRRRVTFRRHNLLNDLYPQGFHLILCRNVIIYFTDAAKERVYAGFAQSLKSGGYLLLGNTESLFRPGGYGLEVAGTFLYRRVEAVSGRPIYKGSQRSLRK